MHETDESSAFLEMTEEELLILCDEDQVQGACMELDRRGVEPIPLPLGPEPVRLAA